ncbi:5'-methylthioadenosine/S-adenosylhomocysteine nucleosidase [Prosthecomicrobium hirschii]|uniref:5'-methylthioadenosine/S-adenosylhomocysteine nucleosidase n=1 Tax=Prosthecodimorpha hirschii TaxID=665126 RepID=UPI00221F662C|nr:5'-methylthioadenosine/S-adenosylhomocysteine nucleosidase [Prosthecomicrobium hirschii]MCW1838703.1 5'-methylthioadenosine/S-adenosylhomocysteine nucleosidase [Prosthecomicrobium hirschii]
MRRILAALLMMAAAIGTALAPEPALAAEPAPVLVLSAYAPEVAAIRARIAEPRDSRLGGLPVLEGRLGGKAVVVVTTGISMVNAAMNAQRAIDRYAPRLVVFSGIAGGVDPALGIGDVVVAAQWAQYLEASFARERAGGAGGAGGYSSPGGYSPPPLFPNDLPNFGMIFPHPVGVVLPDGTAETRLWFPVDAEALAVMRRAAEGLTLERCTAASACLDRTPRLVIGGNGVSGQAFVDNAAFRAWTQTTFQASVLDMESAAVAHVARANGVGFIAIRSLSDLAGGGPGENEIMTFLGLAAANSSRVLEAFLAALP